MDGKNCMPLFGKKFSGVSRQGSVARGQSPGISRLGSVVRGDCCSGDGCQVRERRWIVSAEEWSGDACCGKMIAQTGAIPLARG